MLKKISKSLVLATFVILNYSSYSLSEESIANCNDYFDENGEKIKDKELPEELKDLGELLLCDYKDNKKLVNSVDSINILKQMKESIDSKGKDTHKEFERLSNIQTLKPVKNNNTPEYKILRALFKEISSKLNEKTPIKSPLSGNKGSVDHKNTDNDTEKQTNKNNEKSLVDILLDKLPLILSFLSLLVSIWLFFKNRVLEKRIQNVNKNLEDKISKASFKETIKDVYDKLIKRFDNYTESFANINKNFDYYDSSIKELQNKQKSIDLNKQPLGIKNNVVQDYQEPIITKPKTYLEEITEQYKTKKFNEFCDQFNTKRVDIINAQEIMENPDASANITDQPQGNYYIAPSKDSDKIFYLLPQKSSNLKVNNISKKIFLFTRGTEEGNYNNWEISTPTILRLNSQNYIVENKGKIDILG